MKSMTFGLTNCTMVLLLMTSKATLRSASAFSGCGRSVVHTSFQYTRINPRCSMSTDATASEQDPSASDNREEAQPTEQIPLHRSEGIFAVYKPLDWTSNDVVSYIRGILERDARNRGAKPAKIGGNRRRRSRSKNTIKVGHGGTLDPLATGVLVIGVGKGTKEMQGFLSGSKGYKAGGEFGFETTTLDMEGNITKKAEFDHISSGDVDNVLEHFRGTIEQTPPIFSAIRQGGKKLYEKARAGETVDDVEIKSRQVEVHRIDLLSNPDLPKFEIEVECGGGTYIRSLIRDIGYKLDSVATTTYLERTKQGQFTTEDCLVKDDWNPNNIYAAIDRVNTEREERDGGDK